ncbi:hypothetical protein Vadar_031149 [Vaccinium darrowii]|uniref:Uncharacterized protein n=1 Tax=Vaccinium darrowii TaxID=229202 RepID=A0ACB7YB76_9ERIC|nr:hypothetical protein Vadar_031149 [Vaccinium darrowii]
MGQLVLSFPHWSPALRLRHYNPPSAIVDYLHHRVISHFVDLIIIVFPILIRVSEWAFITFSLFLPIYEMNHLVNYGVVLWWCWLCLDQERPFHFFSFSSSSFSFSSKSSLRFIISFLAESLSTSICIMQHSSSSGKGGALRGLRPDIRGRVSLLDSETLSQLVTKALTAEKDISEEKGAENQYKRYRSGQSSGSGYPAKRVQTSTQTNGSGRQALRPCYKCGQPHLAQYHCDGSLRVCYNCGQPGHISTQCRSQGGGRNQAPQGQRQPARGGGYNQRQSNNQGNYKQHARNGVQPHLIEDLRRLRVEIIQYGDGAICSQLTVKPNLLDRIRQAQQDDRVCKRILEGMSKGESSGFIVDKDGVLRLCLDQERPFHFFSFSSSSFSFSSKSSLRFIISFLAESLSTSICIMQHSSSSGKEIQLETILGLQSNGMETFELRNGLG